MMSEKFIDMRKLYSSIACSYLHVWPRRIRKLDVVKSYISFKRFMLDDCSLSRTGIEWGNLVSDRKQNRSVSKFYMYNHIEN